MSKFIFVLVATLVAAAVAFPSRQDKDSAADTIIDRRDSINMIDVLNNAPRYYYCEASKIYEHTPGMTEWCQAHCFNDPPYCPPAQCRCW